MKKFEQFIKEDSTDYTSGGASADSWRQHKLNTTPFIMIADMKLYYSFAAGGAESLDMWLSKTPFQNQPFTPEEKDILSEALEKTEVEYSFRSDFTSILDISFKNTQEFLMKYLEMSSNTKFDL